MGICLVEGAGLTSPRRRSEKKIKFSVSSGNWEKASTARLNLVGFV